MADKDDDDSFFGDLCTVIFEIGVIFILIPVELGFAAAYAFFCAGCWMKDD